jgi:DNA-binding PadR family transcriptional regulator
MSVRSGLLAILTLGPAYGFQLHVELRSRTGARRNVNVGQIYATLDRLITQGAVRSAGLTDDGLPLYSLTKTGRVEALDWLHDTSSAAGEEWPELLDRVLIASSLPHIDVLEIIDANRRAWGAIALVPPEDGQIEPGQAEAGQRLLVAAAESARAAAALAWLDTAQSAIAVAAPGAFHRELSDERPRRGRRPTHSADESLPASEGHR